MVEVIHKLPGRVRLSLRGLQSNALLAKVIELTFSSYGGIKQITASSASGNVLVLYDPSIVPLEEIKKELLKLKNLDKETLIRLELTAALAEASSSSTDSLDESKDSLGSACSTDNSDDNKSLCKTNRCRPVAEEPEELPLKRQIIQSVFTGAILLWVGVKRLFLGPSILSASRTVHTVSSLTTIVAGYPILRSGLSALSGKKINNDLLISMATLVSLLLRESVTGLVVVFLVNLSTLFQTLTLERSRRAIRELLEVQEEKAWVVRNGVEIEVQVQDIVPGDVVVLQPGSKIPVDGQVQEGQGAVNEAMMTGESIPRMKQPGDSVFSGTMVETGNIRVLATKVGDDTALARIIHLVEDARSHRAPIQNFADRFSERFVPFSFLLALAVFFVTRDFRRAMTMLIIACPCAVGLATPTAVSAAMGNGARRGILIKGGHYLEEAGSLDTVLFDKTGTLTEGRPRVSRIISVHNDYSPENVLALAASGELHSNHPLANAVVEKAREMELIIPEHTDDEVVIGHGIRVLIDGRPLLVGSGHWMDDEGIERKHADFEATRMHNLGETVLYVAHEKTLIGLIGVVDKLRERSKEAIDLLYAEGIENVAIISGDNPETVSIISRQLGIELSHGSLMPEDKVDIIKKYQDQGYKVAMVGEGVNDSPALATAHVGIAMGQAGSDAAIETAPIVLQGDDPTKVVQLVILSRRTMEVIRQNFAFAVGINATGILLGALNIISPLTGALLHNLSTLGVVLNSGRLLIYPLDVEGGRKELGGGSLAKMEDSA
ncbi:cation-translocating P-type ATPase [Heliorestis acidaminivorans]|uniref:P-type Cu(+) transporter n=1 Tax=Heliorestis acidaminivorans TaxID=553427 RepID=A0A6I0EYJ1_9FIRM|nr:cation-translocating P-type ATPase [Heliorestis acidaminivorans]KAB2951813.1 cation-translocating P-type ATPase [Heliorestis acidaminivorans]